MFKDSKKRHQSVDWRKKFQTQKEDTMTQNNKDKLAGVFSKIN